MRCRAVLIASLAVALAGCGLRVVPRDDCQLCVRECGGGRDCKSLCEHQDRCDDDDD
jgi:hypothetical protein